MPSSVLLILFSLGILAVSGFPACLMSARSVAGQRLSTGLFLTGCSLGITGTILALGNPAEAELALSWALPWGRFAVSADPLSAFFLLLVFTVSALGSIYGLSYWKQTEHTEDGQKLGVFYGLLAGSMAMVVIARDAVLFLIAWEIMALSAYFAATAEDDKPEVRQAGWVYLVATHIGTLTLIAMFALWRSATGSFSLAVSSIVPPETAGVIFALAVLGFGFKAGLMPLHVWLPGAHANAPSHVSAVMSGVMLKMGIYGIIRMSGLFTSCEPWWGATLLAVGCVTGLFAIVFAMGQRDLKRLLAYSSIENIGIIAMGVGLALLGRALRRPELILLGMGGALFHVWNHGLFKSLLFLGSGAIIHANHTRDIELMGGLSKKMPATSLLFAIGAIAISALPPLNGFAGEWLLYLGLFKTLDPGNAPNLALASCAAAVLAMIGALAVGTFVKLYGTMFLGSPRSKSTEHARDPSAAMLAPMAVLAAACVVIGMFPMLVTPFLESALNAWNPRGTTGLSIGDLAPQAWISYVGIGLALCVAVLAVALRISGKRHGTRKGITWDCGYAKPTARMQYTGTGLGQTVVKLFSFALWPRTRFKKPQADFPEKTKFETAVPDTILERLVLPVFAFFKGLLPKVYVFQRGQTHLYVLYVFLITIALFIFGGTGVGL